MHPGSLLLPAAASFEFLKQGLSRTLGGGSYIVNHLLHSHCRSQQQDGSSQQPAVSTKLAHCSYSSRQCSVSSCRLASTNSTDHNGGFTVRQDANHLPLLPGWPQYQQFRGYAAKGKGKTAAAPPPAAPKAPKAVDPYAPPEFKMKRVPQQVKGNVLDKLTDHQKALLQQLNPSSAPLRSLRQLGWPLGSKQTFHLLHDQLGEAAGTNVQVLPFVLEGMFQSATTLANVVKEHLEEGRGMPQVEQLLLTTIANLPPSERTFDGIKVQVKGRMSGKGGMTTKRVWNWGRTSTANVSDPVDYAHEAVITRAGYVGVKVWIRYKRSVMEAQAQHSTRAQVSVPELLASAPSIALPSRSSSAWWSIPGPLQPQPHKAWHCFNTGYDPLTATLASPQQQSEQETQ